ncbi:MAG: hypothetical protein IJ662_00680 [Clostridia bacterium]|nr:hypothetical protein [Clostridia bacterium]
MNDESEGFHCGGHAHPISSAEAERYLRGNIDSLSVPSCRSDWITPQSCDCREVLISTDRGLLLAAHEKAEGADERENEGRILFFTLDSVSSDFFDRVIRPPRGGAIRFGQMRCDDTGWVEAVKFLYGSRMLYLFSFAENLVVTKSVNELAPHLFDDEAGRAIAEDDSILFS